MDKQAQVNALCRGCMTLKPCTCGFNEATHALQPHHLPLNTILAGKYLLGRVIGEGGFGITYVGWDITNERRVAIKEFYPTGYVTRESARSCAVAPYTGENGEFFSKGRARFLQEAQKLGKFSRLPAITKVLDYFQENGTAYIVMEFVDGWTLKEYLKTMKDRLPWGQVIDMMQPVMEALAEVHKAGIIHRDISPDNIMVSKEGDMKLLDFGAAREYLDNHSMSVLLKPGYAPEEQYYSRGKQGPWTDVYALCATMYRAVTGVVPPESTERLSHDILQTPTQLGAVLPPDDEAALLRGLAVRAEGRLKDIPALQKAFKGKMPTMPKQKTKTGSAPVPVPVPAPSVYDQYGLPAPPDPTPKKKRRSWLAFLGLALVALVGILIWGAVSSGPGSGVGLDLTTSSVRSVTTTLNAIDAEHQRILNEFIKKGSCDFNLNLSNCSVHVEISFAKGYRGSTKEEEVYTNCLPFPAQGKSTHVMPICVIITPDQQVDEMFFRQSLVSNDHDAKFSAFLGKEWGDEWSSYSLHWVKDGMLIEDGVFYTYGYMVIPDFYSDDYPKGDWRKVPQKLHYEFRASENDEWTDFYITIYE